MIAAAIVACEAAFWVLLLGGLTERYLLGRARLGAVLLVCVPLTDVVLLAVTAADLARGSRADWTHGLGAVYLGFSVVFGPALVRDADRRFASRFADGPPGVPAADSPLRQWRLWARCLLASVLACGVLAALVLVAGDPEHTRALWLNGGWFAQLGVLCVLWLLFGPGLTSVSRHGRGRVTRPQGDRPA